VSCAIDRVLLACVIENKPSIIDHASKTNVLKYYVTLYVIILLHVEYLFGTVKMIVVTDYALSVAEISFLEFT